MIIESTAKGMGDVFHELWMGAMEKKNEFMPIFIPWHWDPDNIAETKHSDYVLTDEDKALMDEYGLSRGQMIWRARTIAGLAGNLGKFKQEYPICPDDCFSGDDDQGLFKAEEIMVARKNTKDVNRGKEFPLVVGIDPHEGGGDKTGICWRRGFEVIKLETIEDRSPEYFTNLVNRIIEIIENDNPTKVFIDKAGGSQIVSHLLSFGYSNVEHIDFGWSSLEPKEYRRRRDYMYGMMRRWFDSRNVRLPDDEYTASLGGELTAMTYYYDNRYSYMCVAEKKEIKKRLGRSPDLADSLALTFGYPIQENATSAVSNVSWRKVTDREPVYDW
jgi:hypothetical protein